MVKAKAGNYTSDLKKTGSVTRMPGMLLRIKGKLDSHCGQGVCDAYIMKLRSRLAAIESREVTRAENELFDSRKEAAVILTSFAEKRKRLEGIPQETNGISIEEIRTDRKNAQKREDIEKDILRALESLTSINEAIVNVDTILEERIYRARNHADAKIQAYVEGVRSGGQEDYRMTDPVDDRAREAYRRKHQMLDGKIREMAKSVYEEEEYGFIY